MVGVQLSTYRLTPAAPSPCPLPSPAVPRPPRTVPVLFVHGHLGSHQQMRSLASETGRELRRRLAAGRLGPQRFWLDWFAPNFNAQPSALESHLLVSRPGWL